MSTYIKLSTMEYPRHIGDIEIDPAGMSDYAPVEWVDPPSFAPETQRLKEGLPVQNGDKWLMNWVVSQIPEEEMAAKIRKQRDVKLAETDWRFRTDMNPSQAWKDYCQALRDVPQQAGFPWSVTWPDQP